jgi:hypothetical protein
LLVDAFGRIREVIHQVVDGLTPEQLAFRVDPEANSIAWLVWHLTRIQDDHLADVAQAQQVWTWLGWVERFGLPFDPLATGYGHRADEVAAVQVDSGELLVGYYDAIHEQTTRYVERLGDADLVRTVDRSGAWVGGSPVPRPALNGDREGLLCGFLREVEVAEEADQRSEHPAPLLTEGLLEGRYQYRSAGRTSIAPPTRAAGIREASSIAASRSSASKT